MAAENRIHVIKRADEGRAVNVLALLRKLVADLDAETARLGEGSTVWTQRNDGLERSRVTSYCSSSSTSSSACRRPRSSSGRSRSSPSNS